MSLPLPKIVQNFVIYAWFFVLLALGILGLMKRGKHVLAFIGNNFFLDARKMATSLTYLRERKVKIYLRP